MMYSTRCRISDLLRPFFFKWGADSCVDRDKGTCPSAAGGSALVVLSQLTEKVRATCG